MSPACRDCRFFQDTTESGQLPNGQCRRHPPAWSGYGGDRWPGVEAGGWCGEFAPPAAAAAQEAVFARVYALAGSSAGLTDELVAARGLTAEQQAEIVLAWVDDPDGFDLDDVLAQIARADLDERGCSTCGGDLSPLGQCLDAECDGDDDDARDTATRATRSAAEEFLAGMGEPVRPDDPEAQGWAARVEEEAAAEADGCDLCDYEAADMLGMLPPDDSGGHAPSRPGEHAANCGRHPANRLPPATVVPDARPWKANRYSDAWKAGRNSAANASNPYSFNSQEGIDWWDGFTMSHDVPF